MKAYVIAREGHHFTWEPDPPQLENPAQEGFSWVEGDSDEELMQVATERFGTLFDVNSAHIEEVKGLGKAVILDITPVLTNENGEYTTKLVADIEVDFRRVRSEFQDKFLPH